MNRIFYIIPYNTILDRNAEDIQKALGDSISVLVHHSNVVKETEEDETAYRRLTERWDSEIILTSLVQFLNEGTTFSLAEGTGVQRGIVSADHTATVKGAVSRWGYASESSV